MLGELKMSKKLAAAFLVVIFAFSTVVIAAIAQAHSAIERPTSTVPYGAVDSDQYLPTGYAEDSTGNATTTASGADGGSTIYSADGQYEVHQQPATYELSVESPGYAAKNSSITVGSGQDVTGYNFYLEQSHVPIPEFGPVIALVSTLGASLFILRNCKKGN
jgi:proteasome assembly chaperone (PAC2) family protein